MKCSTTAVRGSVTIFHQKTILFIRVLIEICFRCRICRKRIKAESRGWRNRNQREVQYAIKFVFLAEKPGVDVMRDYNKLRGCE